MPAASEWKTGVDRCADLSGLTQRISGFMLIRGGPCAGIAHLDGVGGQTVRRSAHVQESSLNLRSEAQQVSQVMRAGRFSTMIGEKAFQVLLSGLLAVKSSGTTLWRIPREKGFGCFEIIGSLLDPQAR
jgi:hypothetical protein